MRASPRVRRSRKPNALQCYCLLNTNKTSKNKYEKNATIKHKPEATLRTSFCWTSGSLCNTWLSCLCSGSSLVARDQRCLVFIAKKAYITKSNGIIISIKDTTTTMNSFSANTKEIHLCCWERHTKKWALLGTCTFIGHDECYYEVQCSCHCDCVMMNFEVRQLH